MISPFDTKMVTVHNPFAANPFDSPISLRAAMVPFAPRFNGNRGKFNNFRIPGNMGARCALIRARVIY